MQGVSGQSVIKGWLHSVVRSLVVVGLVCGSTFSHANSGGGGGGAADALPLEPMVINLKDSHFVQFKPLLKLTAPEKADMVRASIPIVRHALLKFMIGRDIKEVGGTKFMGDFPELVAEALNEALEGKFVKEVLFDSWLVQ